MSNVIPIVIIFLVLWLVRVSTLISNNMFQKMDKISHFGTFQHNRLFRLLMGYCKNFFSFWKAKIGLIDEQQKKKLKINIKLVNSANYHRCKH